MSSEAGKILVFSVAGSELGIPVDRVRFLSPVLPITPVPYLPTDFLGLVNFRGDLCLTIDLAARLRKTRDAPAAGAPPEPALIVLEPPRAQPPRCLLVDGLLRVSDAPGLPASPEAPEPPAAPEVPIEILDVDSLFSSQPEALP
jgi:chemotaxis signal transduction protein